MNINLLYLQIIGLFTVFSYIYFLPKIDKNVITAGMPQYLENFSLFSVLLAIVCYLTVLYKILNINFSKDENFMIYFSLFLFLISSCLWAPLLFYASDTKWAVISSLIFVSFASILYSYTLSKKKLDMIVYICLLYLVFHTTIVDATLWSYYFYNLK